jgi:heavy metal translocating P-type ATPase
LMAKSSRALSEGVGELAVRVHAPGATPTDAHELAQSVHSYEGVRSVLHDAMSGTMVVVYDKTSAAARFLRGALLDRIRARAEQVSVSPVHLQVSVLHELPGRVRLRLGEAPPGAVERLAAFVASLDGVLRARASPTSGSLLVLFDPKATSTQGLLAAIGGSPPAAWPSAGLPDDRSHLHWAKASFSAGVLGAAVSGLLPVPLMLGAVAVTAIAPARRALGNLRAGRVNVDVMDATAIGICLVRSEPITATVITTLLAIGDLILDRTHARARGAISRLMKLDDGEAFLLEGPQGAGAPRRIHPRELRVGNRIVVYPGGRVPADGVVIEGSLAVDEKALTGESLPRERLAGERVLAASVALHGQAVIEVERAGSDTVAARIVRILEGAGAKPMTLQRNAERYADRLVLPTFAVAGGAWALTGAVDRLTSVLITDFGTGVRVAVPTAALTAMTLAARSGILVKGASFLERLAEVDTVVFDKTGTLTLGVPEVTAVVPTGDRFNRLEVAGLAAAAESNQSHPIADALRRHAQQVGAPVWEVEFGTESYRIGLGLEARVCGRRVCVGNARMLSAAGIDPARGECPQSDLASRGASTVLLAVDGELAAVIGYADAVRPESRSVVASLRGGGRRRVMLLSGDARAPVTAIANYLGIDEAIAEVLPEDKAEVVRRLKAQGSKVAMVGDGINDAPALAVADIGISLHGGTDVALETADVVLLEGGLARLPVAFQLADDAMARVKQVLGVVLAPNALAILAGALGWINPVAAAVVNNGSTIAAALHAVAPLLRPRARDSSSRSHA